MRNRNVGIVFINDDNLSDLFKGSFLDLAQAYAGSLRQEYEIRKNNEFFNKKPSDIFEKYM